MKLTIACTVLLLGWLLTAQSLPSWASELPERYLGVWQWASHDGACKSSDWGSKDNLVRLGPDKIEYWESSCRISKIERKSEFRDNEFAVDLVCSGEGEKWTAKEVWYFTKLANQVIAAFANMTAQSVAIYKKCTP